MRNLVMQNNSMYKAANETIIDERKTVEHIESHLSNCPNYSKDWIVVFENENKSFGLTKDELSRKVLIPGDTGEGKTNAFHQLITKKIDSDDKPTVSVVFDSKNDYISLLNDRKNKYVLRCHGSSIKWNIIKDIMCDEDSLEESAQNIASVLVNKNDIGQRNAFFVNASMTIISVILLCLVYDQLYKGINTGNADIVKMLRSTPEEILEKAEEYDLEKRIKGFISPCVNGAYSGQTAGCMGELATIAMKFTGNFAENGDFSIRSLLRSNESAIILLDYDISIAESISPIFTAFITSLLKEKLGKHNDVRLNLFMDEFPLLQYIPYMESAVSFGREKGIFMAISFQHIGQIRDVYGENKADGMLNNFRNIISFFSSDKETRNFIQNRFGEKHTAGVRYSSLSNRLSFYELANRVKDEDIVSLRKGEALISTADEKNVFKFMFKKVKD